MPQGSKSRLWWLVALGHIRPCAVAEAGVAAALCRGNTFVFSHGAQRRASSTCLLVFRKCHYWFVPTEWLIGSYGKCWLPAARRELCSSLPLPRHQARTSWECCLSVQGNQVSAPTVANLCHPEFAKQMEGCPVLLPEVCSWLWNSLNSRELVAVVPARAHLSMTWQGTLPVGRGHYLSLPFRVSQFPTCTMGFF